jgi:signal transduction histidine kinase
VGQTLTLLKLNLEMMAGGLPDASRGRLEAAGNLVNELLQRVRQLSVDLRPGVLDDLGLVAALLGQFDRFGKQTGIRVHFEHQGVERRFPPDIETAAFRMVQEALTNVARHAGARVVTVRAWSDGAQLGIQVRDDGHGFETGAAGPGAASRGLVGMRERLELLGGRLTIDSAPGQGCRLTGELPLGTRPASDAEEDRR